MDLEVTLYILGGVYGPRAMTQLGASCDLLKVKRGQTTNFFMIDAGMDMGLDASMGRMGFSNPPYDLNRLEEILDGHKIDQLFLTHAHTDHVGYAIYEPVRENLADSARIICTNPTAAFYSDNLMNELESYRSMRKRKLIDRLPYTEREAFLFLRRLYDTFSRPEALEIVPDHIWVYPSPAGHMRGACGYTFRVKYRKQDVKIMFSGDRACHSQLSTRGAPLPPKEWYPDIIASYDCTNGGDDLTQGGDEATFWMQELARMMAVAKKCDASREWFFASAFAMERFPTVAQTIADMGLSVYGFSPSAQRSWRIMNSKKGFWCNGDMPVDGTGVNFLENLEDAANLEEPTALIASSGMGHGPAAKCYYKFLPMENAVVASTGFAADDTNNFRIADAQDGEKILLRFPNRGGEEEIPVVVRARREKFRLTAHSLRETAAKSAEELLRYSQFKEPMLGLKHGPTPALDWFESRLGGFDTFRQDRPEDRCIQLV
ncbi:MAG: hypothetical protein UX07_C0007G0004 [Parcubacteria group bacterium GW2011_GWA2_45_30]|nr:MAG: hypothetical protein UX07_C0007G0004 [Parcubacteria group bacterium GW2011_GWA2_45_30]